MTKKERVEKWNENFYRWNAFNNNDKTYIVLGNTYEIKDELKSKGAKFSRELGWHFSDPVDGYNLYEISVDDVAYKTDDGKIIMDYEKAEELVKKIQNEHTVIVPTNSEYIGEIGETYTNILRLKRVNYFSTVYGDCGAYTFIDTNENTIVWITGADKKLEKGKDYCVQGKIKDHREYRGDKQTIITRCKYYEVEG